MSKRAWLICLLLTGAFLVAAGGAYLGSSLVAKRDVPERKEGPTIGDLKARLAFLISATTNLYNPDPDFASRAKPTPEQEERARRMLDQRVAKAIAGFRERDGLGEREAVERALEHAERAYLKATINSEIRDKEWRDNFWKNHPPSRPQGPLN